MNVPVIEMPVEEARTEWRRYVDALKGRVSAEERKMLEDFRRCYNQLKNGRKLVDVFKAIKKGGLNEHYEPRIAIAPADSEHIYFHRREAETWGAFSTTNSTWRMRQHARVVGLPEGTFTAKEGGYSDTLEAPVPIIPALYRPSPITKEHFVLWEVEAWENVPPSDPWLLKRLTENLFVVLAGWDLTDLEKSVMAGRIA